MLPMAEPSTNMSPGSTSGMSAARAEENGTPVSTGAEQQRAQRGKGHAGIAISPAVPTRNRSQTIITRRQGKDRPGPRAAGRPRSAAGR
jgi:hypothetical protein